MWDILLQLLSSSSTPWIVGIITAFITGWWALKKLRYEKRLEKFKETNASLFKERKQEVLAAIATLSIFKRDPEFEKNTIDVLLSRLYTELDYDVINSILTTLIQDSNREELLYIARGLQDINRNFFIQEHPLNLRLSDMDNALKKLDESNRHFGNDGYKTLLADKKVDAEIYVRNKELVQKKYEAEFLDLFSYQKYKLVWHKQVTADAYAAFMRKAFLTKERGNLVMDLFQNDFNYVYMAEVTTTVTKVKRSAFGYGTFAETDFFNITFERNSFINAVIKESSFKGGSISDTDFSKVNFEGVVFENITFTKTKFNTTDFRRTKFINCSGLQQADFTDAICYDDECIFPHGIIVENENDYRARITETQKLQTAESVTE